MSIEAPNVWRVFVAIQLPLELRESITKHISCLREQFPDVRASWSREENVHLTLKFVGDTPVKLVEDLSQAVAQSALAVPAFQLTIEGCGAFPSRGTPRVLWVGIESPTGELGKLHHALERDCESKGFARERRPFHPHLTIARLRKPHGARQLAEVHRQTIFEKRVVSVNEVCVIRSELSPDGSRYTVLSQHQLQKR
jgi:RNA 2',3'-cyclic 3'-phosphodiesterase